MSCHPRNVKFIRHFQSLHQDATRHNNASLARGYAQIVHSLHRYPLPIESAIQAECLQGVGPVQLQAFQSVISGNADDGGSMDDTQWRLQVQQRAEEYAHQIGGLPRNDTIGGLHVPPVKKMRRIGIEKTYFPPIGGCKWAVMVILHSYDDAQTSGMSVPDLHRAVENMHAKYPKTTKFGDSVINAMIKDGVISKLSVSDSSGRQNALFGSTFVVKVKLTDKGKEAGNYIWTKSLQTEDLSTLLGLNEFTSNKVTNRDLELVLLVDSREVAVSGILENSDFLSESRSLPVSDFLWLWRKRTNKGDEYVSGFAVERKTIEDLSTSIKDGRYEEQKSRLAKAPGISRVVYMIEGSYEETAQTSVSLVSEQAIRTAIRHTELTPGFSVVETKNIQDTANALMEMHALIESMGFMGCDDMNAASIDMNDLVTFRDFCAGSHKSNRLTVAQMTARMLRVLPGVGSEAIGNLNEYLEKTGIGGLTIANVAKVVGNPALSSDIKDTLGLKRTPFNSTALASLKEQYTRTS